MWDSFQSQSSGSWGRSDGPVSHHSSLRRPFRCSLKESVPTANFTCWGNVEPVGHPGAPIGEQNLNRALTLKWNSKSLRVQVERLLQMSDGCRCYGWWSGCHCCQNFQNVLSSSLFIWPCMHAGPYFQFGGAVQFMHACDIACFYLMSGNMLFFSVPLLCYGQLCLLLFSSSPTFVMSDTCQILYMRQNEANVELQNTAVPQMATRRWFQKRVDHHRPLC